MKPTILRVLFIVFTCVFVLTSKAQIRTKIFPQGIPANRIAVQSDNVPIKILKAPNELLQLQKSNEIPIEYSNRFAISKLVDFNFLAEAKMIEEKGFTTYVLTIHAEKALNISLEFKEFLLSENSFLSIYTQHELTDSITSKENNQYKIWATRVYQGNKLTILLRLPIDEKPKVNLGIGKINFGYKKFGTDYFGNPGASAACNVNVVCPEAVGWENERNSVALIVVNGQESCTGSLVMNTCNTNRPYFLTANHCIGGNIANWVFQFQTWSTTCIGNNGWREDVQFNGATLRANNAASDFALLELNQIPPANSGITYSGWNRNINAPNGSVGIHHPAGDLMKFSRDFDASGVSSWGGTNNHWVSVFEQGTVQPGSSGSPLYDINHRVVGQLHGDQQNQGNYCAQRRGEYGKFDQSWVGGGTNVTRLSNWLDPNNTGVMTTNTTDIANLISIRPADYSISGPAQFCTSGNYSIPNLPVGATLQWIVTPIYGQQSQSVNNNILTLNRVTDGSATISAIITFCGNTIQVPSRTVQVGGTVITVTPTQTSCEGVQFNVSGAAPGATYNWSSNGNTILYNGTSTTATTSVGQIDAVISGYDIAIVNTTNTCGQSINVGGDYNPYQREIQGLYPEYTSGDHVSVSVNTTPYDTYYRWYINNTLVKEGSYAYYYCTCYYETPDARVCGENTIRVEVETSCGINSSFDAGFYRICGYYRTQSNVELFPNPARDQVTVRLKQINTKQTTGHLKDIREVKIMDKLGSVKKIMKYPANTKTISVNVSNLLLDIYYIEVSDGRNNARVPLSIQR